eukprot:UN01772
MLSTNEPSPSPGTKCAMTVMTPLLSSSTIIPVTSAINPPLRTTKSYAERRGYQLEGAAAGGIAFHFMLLFIAMLLYVIYGFYHGFAINAPTEYTVNLKVSFAAMILSFVWWLYLYLFHVVFNECMKNWTVLRYLYTALVCCTAGCLSFGPSYDGYSKKERQKARFGKSLFQRRVLFGYIIDGIGIGTFLYKISLSSATEFDSYALLYASYAVVEIITFVIDIDGIYVIDDLKKLNPCKVCKDIHEESMASSKDE